MAVLKARNMTSFKLEGVDEKLFQSLMLAIPFLVFLPGKGNHLLQCWVRLGQVSFIGVIIVIIVVITIIVYHLVQVCGVHSPLTKMWNWALTRARSLLSVRTMTWIIDMPGR